MGGMPLDRIITSDGANRNEESSRDGGTGGLSAPLRQPLNRRFGGGRRRVVSSVVALAAVFFGVLGASPSISAVSAEGIGPRTSATGVGDLTATMKTLWRVPTPARSAFAETASTTRTSAPPRPPATPTSLPSRPRPAPTGPVASRQTRPPVTTATTTAASGYGCSYALAYLVTHAAPGFQFECPGYALGHQAMTCLNEPGVCPGGKLIAIHDPCPAAYMNEASNSWVVLGLRDAPIDPYGYCH